MRKVIGWMLLAAGLAGVATAAVTGFSRAAEIAALRESLTGRVAERRVTREQLVERRQLDAGLRASRDAIPDSIWAEERSNVFKQLMRNEREIRALHAQELGHTRWITLDQHKLARKKRALAVGVGALGGGGLVACAAGWVLVRRRVGT
ncbi:MAG: hypothetical protein OEO21_11370 [Candidatus Krumholzibacteria bacterium]|nr:hypothetical protein [Candidatus Krumholzibacteria bacterium]